MIVMFTDFGLEGPYTGQMIARLQQYAPSVQTVSLFANAPSQNPKAAAYLLAAYANEFLEGSIFLSVVDPGVGGDRPPVMVETDGRWYVGPGNGLFELVRRCAKSEVRVWEITWRPANLSKSFHGRDLFAPVAAMLSNQEMPSGVLKDANWNRFKDWPADLFEIVYIDIYGNAMTGISGDNIDPTFDLLLNHGYLGYASTFSDVPQGHPFWYVNANGLIEIAVNGGSAAELLDVRVGMQIEMRRNG